MANQPAIARPSASVILVRDGPDDLEAFMVRRHARSPVAPSAYVFPGGTVRADDMEVRPPDPILLARHLSERSDVPVEPAAASALYMCAIRELFEEAGVLCVRDQSGAILQVEAADVQLQERLESTRLALQAHDLSLMDVLDDWGWTPALDMLIPFSHWVTPAALAARFDTWFFVAAMPPYQAALHDTIETSEGAWLRPIDVLDGDYHTVYATAQHLHRLRPFSTITDLLAFSSEKAILRVQPNLIEARDGVRVALEPDVLDNW